MKLPSLLLLGLLPVLSLTACKKTTPTAEAAAAPIKGELVAATDKDAAFVAAETAKYPLQVCTVSGDKLGSMGKPMAYIWKEAGKPDRLVLFCCNDCPPEFRKEPAKYLAMIK